MAAVFWVQDDLELFLAMLIDETRAGTIHFTWRNTTVFQQIAERLQQQTGKNYTSDMVNKEFHRLHTRYYSWQERHCDAGL
ncbi:hypothetical protein ACJIZ3_011412 [Penstemon smallii]|uniref:Myb/SANT-like domain-containing protein n=1 Tax=Penstemon smallii TaxID=265156 RepID=A0ABD3UJG2_9LAMI